MKEKKEIIIYYIEQKIVESIEQLVLESSLSLNSVRHKYFDFFEKDPHLSVNTSNIDKIIFKKSKANSKKD